MKSDEEEYRPTTRVEELYLMYKTMKTAQQLNYEKTEEDREKNEMSQCTFMPKINPLNKEIFFKNNNDLYDGSNESYIKRMKKIRDDKMDKERKRKEMSDKRMRITVPKEFHITSGKKGNDNKKENLVNNVSIIILSTIYL